jgi:molybdopterin-containing oxidoreductase family iron-sulfur binding subunit
MNGAGLPPYGDPWGRRQILKMMAAGMALGSVSGCDGDSDALVPAVLPATDMVPGVPGFYSSSFVVGGYAEGILVAHRDGRPVKVEGNPKHPASLGATDVFAQAMLLGFYDPDRARGPQFARRPAGWSQFVVALDRWRSHLAETRGEGFRILTGTVTSPTLAAQIAHLRADYPGLRWHQWEAVSRDTVRAGAQLAYGRHADLVARLDKVDVLLALDSDLLSSAPGHLAYARAFAKRRNPARSPHMSRVYAVESTPTLTGMAADHRFVVSPADMRVVLAGLAAVILRNEAVPDGAPPWLDGVAADLKAHRGAALLHVGPDQPAEAHALVHALNEALEGRGNTYDLLPTAEEAALDQHASLAELVRDMQAGTVDTLLILGCNPAFTAPADLGFEEAMKRVAFSVNLADEPNETSAAATWHIPEAHPFEAWGDARAFDGSATIQQAQSLPLYGGRSAHEMLALFGGDYYPDGHTLMRRAWHERLAGDQAWRQALIDGVVEGTASAPIGDALRRNAGTLLPPAPASGQVTVLFRPDPHLLDGRFANNAWLQELPRPLTKLVWDNPLLIPPALADRLGIAKGDKVALTVGDRRIETAAWILHGQAGDCVTALFGFGRRRTGSVGEGAGFDYFRLRGSDGQSQAAATLEKIPGHYPLASTDRRGLLTEEERELARQSTLAAFLADSQVLKRPGSDDSSAPTLYGQPPARSADTAWGMSIDLNACIGCNACVIACQAENNIPVVGKEQVALEREMHWLRIDLDEGDVFQPVLCMQCEEAPCEVVCPVEATVHDAEGLNAMVYNRCIGTRFCANNCPYKVRRFNYLAFSAEEKRPAQSRNPDVTVRGRGVMEKCTFCVQRIAAARIQADIENRPIRDGELQTACQAACPTQAFTFGNIRDSASEVSRRKASPLSYAMLGDLNTRPRVTYEGRIRNPSGDVEERG